MKRRKLTSPLHPLAGLLAPVRNGQGGGGAGTGTLNRSPFLQSLYAERDELEAFIERTVNGAMTGGEDGKRRDLSVSERETLTKTRSRIAALDEQIEPLEEFEKVRAAGNAAARNYPPAGPSDRPGSDGGNDTSSRTGLGAHTNPRGVDYKTRGQVIVDQLRAAPGHMGGQSDPAARERLMTAGVRYPGMSDDEARALVTQVTGDTPGILPIPIIGEVMNDVDAARPFVNSVGPKAMAFAGETFKRPLITQHTAVGKQTTQATNTGIGSQKLVIGSVTFTKETWGGALQVSRQDIDWTSPSAWDAILNDLTQQYGLSTENVVADTFATAVTVATEVVGAAGIPGGGNLQAWIAALYASAALAYAGAGELPDTIWMSLDMWSGLGPLIDAQMAMQKSPGTSSLASFGGILTDLPRVVVPSFANGTLVIGAKRWTEVYEERLGLLQAVNPSILGVDIAYGGYIAFNTIKPAAFAKVTNTVA